MDAHGPTHEAHPHAHHRPGAAGDGGATAKDPVCGMDVDSATSKHSLKYREKAYHFCSAGCRSKFEAAPEQYLGNTNEKARADELPGRPSAGSP